MPEISVIVPVYNVEVYLRKCIDSILCQQFSDWELILVDDGSTDSSSRICLEAARQDERIKVVGQENGGLSKARNAGLAMATGRYVTFVDSDDELYPYSLSTLYGMIRKYPVSVAAGRYVYARHKPDCHPSPAPEIRIEDARCRLVDILYQKPETDTSSVAKLYDRRIFDELRFYDGYYEDLELLPRLYMKVERIAVTNSVVYFYRRHSSSFINSWSESRRDILKVTASLEQRFQSYGRPELLKAARHRHISAAFNLLRALYRFRPDDSEGIGECMEIIRNLRKGVLKDTNSRLKNRVAALLSYLGPGFFRLLAR